MATKDEVIRELRAKLDELERDFAAKRLALETSIELLSGDDRTQGRMLPSHRPPDEGISGTPLIVMAEKLLVQFKDERWTAKRMVAYMRELKYPLNAERPERSVGVALSKLAKTGKAKTLRPGRKGSQQGVYQWNEMWKGPTIDLPVEPVEALNEEESPDESEEVIISF